MRRPAVSYVFCPNLPKWIVITIVQICVHITLRGAHALLQGLGFTSFAIGPEYTVSDYLWQTMAWSRMFADNVGVILLINRQTLPKTLNLFGGTMSLIIGMRTFGSLDRSKWPRFVHIAASIFGSTKLYNDINSPMSPRPPKQMIEA